MSVKYNKYFQNIIKLGSQISIIIICAAVRSFCNCQCQKREFIKHQNEV